jgi:hypothetical protein
MPVGRRKEKSWTVHSSVGYGTGANLCDGSGVSNTWQHVVSGSIEGSRATG